MIKPVKKIGIIGLGLIGGSVAKALKASSKGYTVSAWDKDRKSLDLALDEKAIDEKVDKLSSFSDSDVIFLCIPVGAMKPVLLEIQNNNLSTQCILTDAGSTKSDVMTLAEGLSLKQAFIGGHPLAGSEKSGYSASKANLFENAYYCLTPRHGTDTEVVEQLKVLVQDMGAIPLMISPEAHDRATAAISHVPHVVAALLVNLLGKLDGPENIMKTIAAGGFKDITRIASSSPELWTGICFSNKDIILQTISSFENIMMSFKQDLEKGNKEDVNAFFTSARALRNSFSERKSLIQKTYDIVVDVDDKPGIIALIAAALAKENINIKNIGILNNRETEEGALEIQFENEQSRNKGIETLILLGYRAKSK